MEIISNISLIKSKINTYKLNNFKVGLVPTMGALHKGHISLIERSVRENDKTCCSIYVNPTQFNNKTDLQKYPRTIENDLKLLKEAGCDVVFTPDDEEIYTSTPALKLSFAHLEDVMEGKFRPGHFNGVGIIVAKLFNIVKPDVAYFGQKDLQQFLVIKQMVTDLSFDLELKSVPIEREEDGLAMSSRNVRLNKSERDVAPRLYEALLLAEKLIKSGSSINHVKEEVTKSLKKYSTIQLEYFEIADVDKLTPLTEIKPNSSAALCIAAFVGDVRLIDNLLLFS